MDVQRASRPGQVVPSHFDAATVAASYFASLCGTLLTVEMLHRRGTAVGNLRSWLETVGCATAMGLVGIWCMHFIGNRAIILGNGDPALQLVYSPGFTTLSVFLPIVGLTISFSAAEVSTKSQCCHWALLVCTGVFAGVSIVGMHYIGNLGVSNYYLHYQPQYLAASMIIAIGACLSVLLLFYTLREKWIGSWWKRVCCAVMLAGGVSSMHFTASSDCVYILRDYSSQDAIGSRNIQVTVAGALCGASAVIVLGVLFFTRHRSNVLKSRSQKFMLGIAMFDPDGRILVTTEGVLPAQEITDKYLHQAFSDDFDTSHSVFQWLFRVTRNWSSVADLIPKMKSHVNAFRDSTEDEQRSSSSSASTIYDPDTYSDYSVVFRERFCVAAACLANSLHLPLDRMGVLYDKIVDTGTLKEERCPKFPAPPTNDVEKCFSNVHSFGRGQLLFLARQLTVEDVDKLLNAGYKFASTNQIARHLAQVMQIPLSSLDVHLLDIRRYADSLESVEKPGTWLSFFAMIPKPNNKGFDAVVRKSNQDQLPGVQLLSSGPQQWQADFLHRMDGLRTRACMAIAQDRRFQETAQEQHFAIKLQRAISDLSYQIPAVWLNEARFHAQPVSAYYSQHLRDRGVVSHLYALCVIVDMHTLAELKSDFITRIPLNFFATKQRCTAGSAEHSVLAKEIHQEFGPLLARRAKNLGVTSGESRVSLRMPSRARRRTRSLMRHDGSIPEHYRPPSIGESVPSPKEQHREADTIVGAEDTRSSMWGGILVNSETVINSLPSSEYDEESEVKGSLGMSTRVAVGTTRAESTFVDELIAVTKARFLAPTINY